MVVAEHTAVAGEGVHEERPGGLMVPDYVLGDSEAVGCAQGVGVIVAEDATVTVEGVLGQGAAGPVVAEIGAGLGENAGRCQRMPMAGAKALGPGVVDPGGQVAGCAGIAADEQVPNPSAGQYADVGIGGGGGVQGDQVR